MLNFGGVLLSLHDSMISSKGIHVKSFNLKSGISAGLEVFFFHIISCRNVGPGLRTSWNSDRQSCYMFFFWIKRIPTNLHLLGGERKFNAKIHIKGHSSTITNDKTWNLPSFSLFTSNVFWPITKCGHFSCRTAFTVQGCRLCSKQLGISTHGGRFQVEKRTKYILYSYVCPYPIELMV